MFEDTSVHIKLSQLSYFFRAQPVSSLCQNKVVDAPTTLEKALETVSSILGTPEAAEPPSCQHGHMTWREGEKNGKAWGGYFCAYAPRTGEAKCPTNWYTLGSDGKFQPQKAWA